jgi:hypothetical protein
MFLTIKLVVRGGGGMFYDRIWNNLFETFVSTHRSLTSPSGRSATVFRQVPVDT